MKSISKSWLCQIDVTNICSKDCLYCSRYNRHIRPDQRFFMDIEFFEKALWSLEKWPAQIGIIGGEPTLHPQFKEMCLLLQKKFPRSKLGCWTTGGIKYEEHKQLINQTFSIVAYNKHDSYQMDTCKHQPITIAIQDVVKDKEYMKQLINDCWVQKTWCPTISPKGAFFCEVAYAIDSILDGPGGYPVDQNWWKKNPKDFQDQVSRYCKYCGMAIPIERELIKTKLEKISPANLKLFKEHKLRRLSEQDMEIFNKQFTINELENNKKTWDPGNYRGDIKKDNIQK